MMSLDPQRGPDRSPGPVPGPSDGPANWPGAPARVEVLMTSLLSWIASETGHLVLTLPAVTLIMRPVLSSLSPLAPHRLARYAPAEGTVELALDWHETDPVHQSVLLLALIRHVQVRTPAAGRSAGERDREAYALQARWLRQRGIDFRLAFGLSPALIARLRLDA
jgi:hypothetical protein